MKRRVIFFGPPGSGKGTIARRLQRETGLPHLSSGEILRKEVAGGTDIGRQVESFIENGRLVPDDIVLDLMRDRLRASGLDNGFILDGFPRNVHQARMLDAWLREKGCAVESVIQFQCPDDVVLDRITGRRYCPDCGRNYHLRLMPPKREGVCDECGKALVQRSDDRQEMVRERLQVYKEATEPMVAYYSDSGKLTAIEATQEPARIYENTLAVLN